LTDGSGHRDGTRAVGLARGAWEQLTAIPTATLAAIPDAASDAQAATLPTARMTTLRALEVSRLVLGKRSEASGANRPERSTLSSGAASAARPSFTSTDRKLRGVSTVRMAVPAVEHRATRS